MLNKINLVQLHFSLKLTGYFCLANIASKNTLMVLRNTLHHGSQAFVALYAQYKHTFLVFQWNLLSVIRLQFRLQ